MSEKLKLKNPILKRYWKYLWIFKKWNVESYDFTYGWGGKGQTEINENYWFNSEQEAVDFYNMNNTWGIIL